mgnify:FL=1
MRRPAPTLARWLTALILCGMLPAVLTSCYAGSVWKGSVKIGLVVPFYGYDSGSANAAYYGTKLALQERNENGGIGGRWVELVALDDQNSHDVAARRAREIALDPGVLGAIGHLSSDSALGAAPVYREAGLGAISLGATATDLAETYPEMLRMASDDAAVATRTLQRIAGKLHVQRIAVLHDRSPGHTSAARAFLAEANRRELAIAAVAEIDKGQRDFTPFLEALASNPPQLLVVAGDQFQAAALATQLKKGLAGGTSASKPFAATRLLIAGCASTPDFATIGGEAAKGVLHVDAIGHQDHTTLNVEGASVLENGWPDQLGARYRSLAGVSPTAYAAAAYDATVYILDAMDRAGANGRSTGPNGRIDRASVSREMRRSAGGSESIELDPGSSLLRDTARGVERGRGIEFGRAGERQRATPRLYEIDESGYPGRMW